LQIFTLPIFQEETFFLEVVQRQGARGFGAGNVTALAKSIEQEKKKASQPAVHKAF
jgi:4-hydroxyphenylpyruvate dioxygenase-like putative hemolysin